MGRAMLESHRGNRISEEDYRRVCLWLDLNSPRLGAFNDIAAQEQGQLVWLDLDVDPSNITGVERENGTTRTENLDASQVRILNRRARLGEGQ
jgi:hypothetical protein